MSAHGIRVGISFQSLKGILSDLDADFVKISIKRFFEKVSIPKRDFIGFRHRAHTVELLALFVSIPKRDFIGFRRGISGKRCFQILGLVSIPKRDFIGFRQEVLAQESDIALFQSLKGILSDLDFLHWERSRKPSFNP